MRNALLWYLVPYGTIMPKNRIEIEKENRGETSMEKSRIRPVPAGKGVRMSYSRQKEVLERCPT